MIITLIAKILKYNYNNEQTQYQITQYMQRSPTAGLCVVHAIAAAISGRAFTSVATYCGCLLLMGMLSNVKKMGTCLIALLLSCNFVSPPWTKKGKRLIIW